MCSMSKYLYKHLEIACNVSGDCTVKVFGDAWGESENS